MQAQVVKIHSDFYYVSLGVICEDAAVYECKLRANLKKRKTEIIVGDYVLLDSINESSKQAVISGLIQRKNFLPRPKVANIDKLIIVSAIKEPDLDFEQLNRYITLALYYGINPVLCFNKEDLAGSIDVVEKVFSIYEPLGFEIYFTSAKDKTGIDELCDIMKGNLCAFAGPSGVGKTSIINSMSEDFNLRVGEVSQKTKRGTHTTRHCEILNVKINNEYARLLDSPGFSHLIFDFLLPKDIEQFFPEIKIYSSRCKYSDCLHINEDNCEVLKNLENINTSRYESYCKFVEEAKIYKEKLKKEGYKKESLQKQSGDKSLTKISTKKRQLSRVNEKKETNEYEKYN